MRQEGVHVLSFYGENTRFNGEEIWIFIEQLKMVKYHIMDYIMAWQVVTNIQSKKFVQLYN